MVKFYSCFLKLRLNIYAVGCKYSVLSQGGSNTILIQVYLSSLQQCIKQSDLTSITRSSGALSSPPQGENCVPSGVFCFYFKCPRKVGSVNGIRHPFPRNQLSVLSQCPAAFKCCGRGTRERKRMCSSNFISVPFETLPPQFFF